MRLAQLAALLFECILCILCTIRVAFVLRGECGRDRKETIIAAALRSLRSCKCLSCACVWLQYTRARVELAYGFDCIRMVQIKAITFIAIAMRNSFISCLQPANERPHYSAESHRNYFFFYICSNTSLDYLLRQFSYFLAFICNSSELHSHLRLN